MRVIFMGTPEFAVPCLDRLVNMNLDIVGVFTQPDKPKGRGYQLTPTPVKEKALQNNLEVFQPNSLKNEEAVAKIQELNPDIIVVVAYGKILPKAVLDIPRLGCINVHASLLPKYRGAGPIQWSVINGETETGVTTMYMAEGLDTGDMILKRATSISQDETAGELHDRLSVLGADCLEETIQLFLDGKQIPREVQDDSLSCYAPMLDKSLCKLDFSKTAAELHNLVRGLSPWPVAVTTLNGKVLKIHKTALTDVKSTSVGKVEIRDGRLFVHTSDYLLEILQVQLEGKKSMSAKDFMMGHKISADTILGN